jgi:drug/metabolite transporter (DMT)-like permease
VDSLLQKPIFSNTALLLVAIVWGIGFVPQRLAMEYFDPAAFNALRFIIGAGVLIPVLLINKQVSSAIFFSKTAVLLGLLLGGLIFAGALFQQISIQYTSLANVAFITGMYVIVVPVLGYFIGFSYRLVVWFGGVLAIFGMYLMTMVGASADASFYGDMLAMVGAVFWALQLLVLAKLAGRSNQLVLAFYQFLFCAIFSLIFALGFEERLLPMLLEAYLWPIVNGVLVVGFAYTLQVVVMQHAEPFAAALIFSLEAVFGALAGYFVFAEQLGLAAMLGAAMMLLGCALAQLPAAKTQS